MIQSTLDLMNQPLLNTDKLTTAADVFTFKEKETKKNKIPFLVNAILELIHRGNKNLVPVRKDSKLESI